MKRFSLVVALLVCLPVLAADEAKPWPQKGDTVFVAGDLTGSFMSMSLVLGWTTITAPACVPMTVAFSPKPSKAIIRDESRGAAFQLCGEWRTWLSKSRADCSTSAREHQMTFQRKGDCYSPVAE
jgi:hypothetical protein